MKKPIFKIHFKTPRAKRRFFAFICLVLTLAITIFTFSNSLKDSEKSKEQSGKVVDAVESVCDSVGIKTERKSLEKSVRTAAHFLEYCAIGSTLSAGLLLLFSQSKKNRVLSFLIAFVYTFSAASVDEFVIQSSSAGRVADWTDIATDMSGAMCGMLFTGAVMLIAFLIKKRKRKKI